MLGEVGSTRIPNTDSLDNFWEPGKKYFFQDENGTAVSGKPISEMQVGFVFNIKFLINNRYQFCISNTTSQGIYFRRYGGQSDPHGAWYRINVTEVP